jgi:hypothetical protein
MVWGWEYRRRQLVGAFLEDLDASDSCLKVSVVGWQSWIIV